jgi:hypothetical protein
MKNKSFPVIISMAMMDIFISAIGSEPALAQETSADYTSKVPKFTFANTLEE